MIIFTQISYDTIIMFY